MAFILTCIEHAHLSILCEIRSILHYQIGITNDEIANIFEGWSTSGPLRGNFLVGIGHKGLRFKEGDGIKDERGIVEGIEDKITQDVDQSEGTGTWSTKVSHPPIRATILIRHNRRSPNDTSLLQPLPRLTNYGSSPRISMSV